MIKFKDILTEGNIELAYEKIDALKQGKIFNDAKNIESVFTKSLYSWSEIVENFEKHQNRARLQPVNIKNIKISQPNIQSNKAKNIIANIEKTRPINVVQFENEELAIFDGHHRLIANWALGKKIINVNLVKI